MLQWYFGWHGGVGRRFQRRVGHDDKEVAIPRAQERCPGTRTSGAVRGMRPQAAPNLRIALGGHLEHGFPVPVVPWQEGNDQERKQIHCQKITDNQAFQLLGNACQQFLEEERSRCGRGYHPRCFFYGENGWGQIRHEGKVSLYQCLSVNYWTLY